MRLHPNVKLTLATEFNLAAGWRREGGQILAADQLRRSHLDQILRTYQSLVTCEDARPAGCPEEGIYQTAARRSLE